MTVETRPHAVIEGVAGFSPCQWASSVHGCQARILEHLGEPLGYDDLVVYSGFAFRVGVSSVMCPSAGHPACGYDCVHPGLAALPWSTRVFEDGPWSSPKADRAAFEAEARAAVKDSVDRGVPVHYGSEEDGLIIGYADDGRRWRCVHPYFNDGGEAFWHDEVEPEGTAAFAGGRWPWVLSVWGEPKPEADRPAPGALLRRALRQALDMWRHDEVSPGPSAGRGYASGAAAYDHWIEWLRGVDADPDADPTAGMQGNGWCYRVLADNRRIAGRRLAAAAAGDADLAEAADRFRRAADALTAGLDTTWALTPAPADAGRWTAAMRRDQVDRLSAARGHDAAAIAAIERRLAG